MRPQGEEENKDLMLIDAVAIASILVEA